MRCTLSRQALNAVVLVLHSTSFAQTTCQVGERIKIGSPEPQAPFPDCIAKFGTAVAISGQTAVVGAPNCQVGSAFVMTLDKGVWSIAQPLIPPQNNTDDYFGAAVAISGDVIAVGSPYRDQAGFNSVGGVRVYRRHGRSWDFEAELSPNEPVQTRGFGWSVALSGNTLLVGAPWQVENGLSTGAVFAFQFQEDAWQQIAKLLPRDGVNHYNFGSSVAIDGGLAVIGALPTSPPMPLKGAAYVFRDDGSTWFQEQKLLPTDGANGNLFGESVAVSGERIIIGARHAGTGGAAYCYAHDGLWVQQQKLVPTGPAFGTEFGMAVAIEGDTIVVSAPKIGFGNASLYRLAGNAWVLHHTVRPKRTEFDVSFMLNNGTAMAMSQDTIMLGAPDTGRVYSVPSSGAVLFFDVHPPDCNANDVPDVCEVDCNNNAVPDDCDIASNASRDCNGDGVSDECQVTSVYSSYSSGSISNHIGPVGSKDFIWLRSFTVTSGHEVVTHIAVPWSSLQMPTLPMKLLLYKDPNNDGDPTDGVLVMSVAAPIIDDITPFFNPTLFTIRAVPPTFVGHSGDTFFVGVVVSCVPETYPAPTTGSGLPDANNWYSVAPYGEADLEHLSANSTHMIQYRWMLRAYALDCNGNGISDQCDIASGTSLDINADGVPDECEVTCDADVAPIHGDGTVNIDDLVLVITSWGSCAGCAADINFDRIVNIDDLVMVITHWGPCR